MNTFNDCGYAPIEAIDDDEDALNILLTILREAAEGAHIDSSVAQLTLLISGLEPAVTRDTRILIAYALFLAIDKRHRRRKRQEREATDRAFDAYDAFTRQKPLTNHH